MYILKATEVSFFAAGEEYRLLVANLMLFMREYARVWNVVEMETSVVLDRVIGVERNKNVVRYRIYFNIRRESISRLSEIIIDFLDNFLLEMFPTARHVTYSFAVLK